MCKLELTTINLHTKFELPTMIYSKGRQGPTVFTRATLARAGN